MYTVQPYLDTIFYPDCKDSENSTHIRKLDKKTELMCFLTTCKHTIYNAPWDWPGKIDFGHLNFNFYSTLEKHLKCTVSLSLTDCLLIKAKINIRVLLIEKKQQQHQPTLFHSCPLLACLL